MPYRDLAKEPLTLGATVTTPDRRRTIATSTAAAVCVAAVLTSSQPATAGSGTIVQGTLADDTTWTTTGSPYLVYGPLTIPEGVTLTIEPGVVVDVPYSFLTNYEGIFNVRGSLDVNGTAQAPVELDGGGQDWTTPLVSVPWEGAATADIDIEHANIHDYPAVVPVQSSGGRFELTDSTVTRSGGINLYSTRPGSSVARNFIEDTTGIRVSGPSPVTISDNRFRDTGTSWYSSQPFIASQNAGGVPSQVHGNTFEPLAVTAWGPQSKIAISVAPDGAVDATGNYWHTHDVGAVKARLLDAEDNPTWSSTVPVQPLLAAPTAQTPAASPQRPTDLAPTSTSDTITVAWSSPLSDGGSPVTAFRVTVPSTGAQTTVPADARSATVSGLPPSTMQTIEVVALNAYGSSVPARTQWSTKDSTGVPSPGTPPVFVGPTAPPVGPVRSRPNAPARPVVKHKNGKVTVTWTPPEANGLRINRYIVTLDKKGTYRVGGRTTKLVVKRLRPGKHKFTVIASNAAGKSDPSPIAIVKVPKPKKRR